MIIREINIQNGFQERHVDFTSGINVIYSKQNTTGKTTFIRAILYALGYTIPSTRGLDFSKMEFELKLESDGVEYKVYRRNNYIVLTIGSDDSMYTLPDDFNSLLATITGIESVSVLENLLGVFYADQEKGWTLLNRGNAISKIHFSIDELVSGLGDRDCSYEKAAIKNIDKQIKEYTFMISADDFNQSDNDSEIVQLRGNDLYETSIYNELAILKAQKNALEKELSRVKASIKSNNSLFEYVNKMQLCINHEGQIIKVTRDNLLFSNDITLLLKTRKMILTSDIANVKRKMSELEAKIQRQLTLLDSRTLLDEFRDRIKKVRVNRDAVEHIIDDLKKKRKEFKQTLKEKARKNNAVALRMFGWIREYAAEYGIGNDYIPDDPRCLFTDDLKSLTGTVLHKMIFFYKLAYIRAVREYTGVCLPIILDSPSGREVLPETVKELLKLLPRDFGQHQVIIASIYEYDFKEQNVIEFHNRLFEE